MEVYYEMLFLQQLFKVASLILNEKRNSSPRVLRNLPQRVLRPSCRELFHSLPQILDGMRPIDLQMLNGLIPEGKVKSSLVRRVQWSMMLRISRYFSAPSCLNQCWRLFTMLTRASQTVHFQTRFRYTKGKTHPSMIHTQAFTLVKRSLIH